MDADTDTSQWHQMDADTDTSQWHQMDADTDTSQCSQLLAADYTNFNGFQLDNGSTQTRLLVSTGE